LIPPLIGFFSKLFVLSSAIESGYFFMAIVAILVSVISASYYLKIIKVLHTEAEESILNETENSKNKSIKESGHDSNSAGSQIISTSSKLDIETPLRGVINNQTLLSNFHSFLISSLTLSILLFVLKPSIILNSTQLLSLSLFNY
jgi:NADH-ubiquinone oxidoreductase chain 2